MGSLRAPWVLSWASARLCPKLGWGLWAGGRLRPEFLPPLDLHPPDSTEQRPHQTPPSRPACSGLRERWRESPWAPRRWQGRACPTLAWACVCLRRMGPPPGPLHAGPRPPHRGECTVGRAAGVQLPGCGGRQHGRIMDSLSPLPAQRLAPLPIRPWGGLQSSVPTCPSCLEESTAARFSGAGGSGVGWEGGEACRERQEAWQWWPVCVCAGTQARVQARGSTGGPGHKCACKGMSAAPRCVLCVPVGERTCVPARPVPLGTLGGWRAPGHPHGLQVCLASPEAPAQPLPVQRPHPPSGSPEGLGVPGSAGVLQRPVGTPGPRPGDPTGPVGRAIALLGSQGPPRPVVSSAEPVSGSRHLGRPVGNCSPHPGGHGRPRGGT